MLLDYIKYKSDLGFVQDSDYPEVYHIKLDDMTELNTCKCGGRLSPRDSDKKRKYKIICDYDTRSKCVVILQVRRNNYRCTKCRRTYTANEWMNNLKHTVAFEKYVTLEVIRASDRGLITRTNKNGTTWQQWSAQAFAKRYGYHRDTISAIAKKYAPCFTPLLIPFHGYRFFHLYSFNYQAAKRYYLIASKKGCAPMLLAIFGYQKPITEIVIYLKLHQGFLSLDDDSVIVVEYDFELIEAIKENIKNIHITIRHKSIKQAFENYQTYLFKGESIELEGIGNRYIRGLMNIILVRDYDEYLDVWWDEVKYKDDMLDETHSRRKRKKILQTKLQFLYDLVSEYRDVFDLVCQFDDEADDFKELVQKSKELKRQIKVFSQNGSDFTILAARMMLYNEDELLDLMGRVYAYTADIFRDDNLRDYYLQKKYDPEEELKCDVFFQLLGEGFNQEDVMKLIIDNFWKHEPETKDIVDPTELELTYGDMPILTEDEANQLYTEDWE